MIALSWAAVVLLCASYWFQIYRIHVHKEVRDLSLPMFCCLFIGFFIMGITAYIEGSTIFLTKQILAMFPVGIIIYLIRTHQKDHWHDDLDAVCNSCEEELEPDWKYCPYCSIKAGRVTNVEEES